MIRGKKALCVLAACIGSLFYLGSWVANRESYSMADDKARTGLAVKKILYWNVFFGMEDFAFGFGRKPFVQSNCSVDNCHVTNRREDGPRLEHFDAIIFHAWELYANDEHLKELSNTRRPHQRFVFFLMEAPGIYFSNPQHFRDFFNWTMTYRTDSDIHSPYGLFVPKNNTSARAKASNDSGNGALKKTRLVAWFVSHCETPGKRELYANELRKYIDVDVYGNCGCLKCPGRMSDGCYRMLERKYKFYMSFENSLCVDYVTEKLFAVMQYRVVPVVYGGADYSRILPRGSFIDTSDFSSPEHLAKHLKKLGANTHEYNKYFRWKESHQLVRATIPLAMCKLCAMLNDPSQSPKSYSDIYEWYSGSGVCRDPTLHLQKIGL